MKRFCSLLMIVMLVFAVVSVSLAEIDWSAMSTETIQAEIESGKKELISRGEGEFRLGEPIIIRNEYGSYSFTLIGAHLTDAPKHLMKEKGDGVVVACVQAICENIDCKTYSNDYISNYYIQADDIRVTDQEGFSLEILDYTGIDDGRYEVCAHTAAGEKRRISLTYYAYSDTVSVIVTVPDRGSVEIPLK